MSLPNLLLTFALAALSGALGGLVRARRRQRVRDSAWAKWRAFDQGRHKRHPECRAGAVRGPSAHTFGDGGGI